MGFVADLAKKLRSFWKKDKELASNQLATGSTNNAVASDQRDLLFGLGVSGYLADRLLVERDLATRYAEYEEMDEYPEIACLVGESQVFTLEWGWRAIEGLVGETFHVLAYDEHLRSLVPAEASAMLSASAGHSKPMVRVTLDNGSVICCTADHPFLLKDESWVSAGKLAAGDRLMPGYTGGTVAGAAKILGVPWSKAKRVAQQYDLLSVGGNHRVLRVETICERPCVYDLQVPAYHNFVCQGVVVHNTAIDIFADDTSQPDTQLNKVIWVESDNEEVRDLLNELLKERLRLDEDMWEISRTLCRYGNNFEEILIADDGVVGLNFLPAPTVRRIEDEKGVLLGFVQDFRENFRIGAPQFAELLELKQSSPEAFKQLVGDINTPYYGIAVFEPWEVVHFRLRSKYRRSVYGFSILEPARWIWKRLTLLEDSAIIFRLTKAVERYAFYIDIGDMPAAEAYAYVNKVRQQYKKKKYINPTTGKLELKFDPLNTDDDIFIPSRGGQDGTRIDVLGGPQWQHMDDIQYFRDKMLAAIKVPRAYLGADEGVTRSILSNEDVRFARSILRVQRTLKNGVHKVCRVHLAARGVDPYAVCFEVCQAVPSAIFELAQLEVHNARADLAARMADFVSLPWILKRIFHLSDDEIKTVIAERSQDVLRNAVDAGKGEAEAQKLIAAAQPQEQPEQPESVVRVGKSLKERRVDPRPGSREEKRMEAQLRKLLQQDQVLHKRLNNLAGLIKDLHMTVQQVGAKSSRGS